MRWWKGGICSFENLVIDWESSLLAEVEADDNEKVFFVVCFK